MEDSRKLLGERERKSAQVAIADSLPHLAEPSDLHDSYFFKNKVLLKTHNLLLNIKLLVKNTLLKN